MPLSLLAIFSHIWLPASAMMAVNGVLVCRQALSHTDLPPGLIVLVLTTAFVFILRGFQFLALFTGDFFRGGTYFWCRNSITIATLLIAALCVDGALCGTDVQDIPTIPVWIIGSNLLWVIELSFGDQFPQYHCEQIALRCIEHLMSCDPIDTDPSSMIETCKAKLRNLGSYINTFLGPISLSTSAENNRQPLLPEAMGTAILDWAKDSKAQHTRKAMWCVMNDGESTTDVAGNLWRLLSDSDLRSGVALVDVSKTRSIFWPFIHGLAIASPLYRREYGLNTPPIFQSYFSFSRRKYLRPLNLYRNSAAFVESLISRPLARIRKSLRAGPGGIEAVPKTMLIVHGVSNTVQARELMAVIQDVDLSLTGSSKFLDILIVSHSSIFQTTAKKLPEIMRSIHTLHVLNSRREPSLPVFFCSASAVEPPPLCENLFSLLLDGLHRTGGELAKSLPARGPILGAFTWRNIENALFWYVLPPWVILSIREDNIKIACALENVFRSPSFKREVVQVAQEHSLAVLNLTHQVLDRGFPSNGVISDWKAFTLHAHRLINSLSATLRLLPDGISITGIVLSNSRPVDAGGFSDIYRGKYCDSAGNAVQVALKVLRFFQDHTAVALETQRKICKEALVWRYLDHDNIVQFLGVDSMTFPSPAMAIVTRWMPQGNVISYISRNSPCSPYGAQLLRDCIVGLRYLHSVAIVHGDLRGGNVLVDDNGHARLADFGLAGFVDAENTGKSSTRGGTTRWMAPELLAPPPGQPFKRTRASDIWAFGCVCCEVWTEGTAPFPHIPTDPAILIAFSKHPAPREMPYLTIPVDKGGNRMPDFLWEVTQSCWEEQASARPTAEETAERLTT
ncbi:hypothetical protein MVEN_00704900 [Mycena venus]|uniref:Protein kinase domain-containing protein n=1 Tax=Mycena venus TaxID=2733690 RepID=A0A8H6YJM4_9AGAR|nr:hypothetical protein MVEN_00704900 [Mycena venus]